MQNFTETMFSILQKSQFQEIQQSLRDCSFSLIEREHWECSIKEKNLMRATESSQRPLRLERSGW